MVWILSPALRLTCVGEHQPLSDSEAEFRGSAGAQLKLHGGTRAPDDASRRDAISDLDDHEIPAEHDDVDRAAHTERVDTAERVVQQEPLVGSDQIPADQPAHRTKGAGWCDRDCSEQQATAFVPADAACPGHNTTVRDLRHAYCSKTCWTRAGSARIQTQHAHEGIHPTRSATLLSC